MNKYHLFSVFGIEIEYMVVDSVSLEPLPISDFLLDKLVSMNRNDVPLTGPIEWYHELVAHVAEAKCAKPEPSLENMLAPWKSSLETANKILSEKNACLLPSAAHPWMNPASALLWAHEDHEIYEDFNRIFGCNTHGWTNLQSVHINLPFADDDEFGRLHAAIRAVLPMIPALAASSPYLDGKFTGFMDARMVEYTKNSLRIPSMTGPLIPEPVFSQQEYIDKILIPIYEETAPLDPERILYGEWANARGAIARFDRGAIEIRVMDSQESPLADLGAAFAVSALVKLLAEERFAPLATLKSLSTERLRSLFFTAAKDAESAIANDETFLAIFGISNSKPVTFGEIWRKILEMPELKSDVFDGYFNNYLNHGTLARRFFNKNGTNPSRHSLMEFMRDIRNTKDYIA